MSFLKYIVDHKTHKSGVELRLSQKTLKTIRLLNVSPERRAQIKRSWPLLKVLCTLINVLYPGGGGG